MSEEISNLIYDLNESRAEVAALLNENGGLRAEVERLKAENLQLRRALGEDIKANKLPSAGFDATQAVRELREGGE